MSWRMLGGERTRTTGTTVMSEFLQVVGIGLVISVGISLLIGWFIGKAGELGGERDE